MSLKRYESACSVEGCNEPSKSLGLCNNHYQMQWKYGRTKKVRSGDKRKNPLYHLWFDRKQVNALVPEWFEFDNFVKDVGERPSKKHFLVRLRDEPYGPNNFQWTEKLSRRDGESKKEWWARKWQSRRQAFPLYETKRYLKRKYGITPEQYEEMERQQKFVCAICSEKETTFDPKTGGIRRLSVDHCHTTGKVRELLCSRCNMTIGRIGESKDLMMKFIAYLTKHKDEF